MQLVFAERILLFPEPGGSLVGPQLQGGLTGSMKFPSIVGILLIAIGIIALVYGGINYTTTEKVLDIGPIEATAERHERIPLPPLLGGIALIGGIALLTVGARRA